MSVKHIESFVVGNFSEIFLIKLTLFYILILLARLECFFFFTELRDLRYASFARKVLQNVCLTFFVIC